MDDLRCYLLVLHALMSCLETSKSEQRGRSSVETDSSEDEDSMEVITEVIQILSTKKW